MSDMPRRHRWPSERREFRDPVTGTRITQLTAGPAHHSHLSAPDTPLTPSGDYLLLTSDRAGGPHPGLFRLEMRTGAIEQVTDTDGLSPDGITPAANGRQAIALLQAEEGEVVAIDLETGEWETLAVFLDAELEGCHRSASGEYVVTVVTQEEEATITAVHTEGMRTVPIQEGLRSAHAARFSPDSKNSVLYVTGDPAEIHCVEFDGSGDRVLSSGVQVFRCSGVRSQRTPGSLTSPVLNTRTPEHLNTCPPIWLGSGEEVVFIAGTEAGPIMAAPRHGGSPRVVSSLPCAWVRSEARGERLVALAMAGAASVDPSFEIVLIDPRSGGARPLCSRCSAWARPCFSPEGRSVLFAGRDDSGSSQIYRASLPED